MSIRSTDYCTICITHDELQYNLSVVYSYVDQKGSTIMLTSCQSAVVAPQVNLRNSMQVRKYGSKKSTLALKPRTDVTISPKQGYQWPHEKDLCPPIIFKKHFSVVNKDFIILFFLEVRQVFPDFQCGYTALRSDFVNSRNIGSIGGFIS